MPIALAHASPPSPFKSCHARSGTVTMFTRHEAAAAMAALNGAQLTHAGAPGLEVAWAQLNVMSKAQQAEVAGAVVAYECVPLEATPLEVRGKAPACARHLAPRACACRRARTRRAAPVLCCTAVLVAGEVKR